MQGGLLRISFKYNEQKVAKIKQLRSVYWHKQQRQWVAPSSEVNIALLQQEFACWSEARYKQVLALSIQAKQTAKVKVNNYDEDYLSVQIWNASQCHEWVKKLKDRKYLADEKKWLIPKDVPFCKA